MFKRVYTGSGSDEKLVNIVRKSFEKAGLYKVQYEKYNDKYESLLSFPDRTKPNVVQFVRNEKVVFMEPNEQWTRASIGSTMQKAAGIIAGLKALEEMASKMPQGMGGGMGMGMGAGSKGAGTGAEEKMDLAGLADPQPYVAYSPQGMVQVSTESLYFDTPLFQTYLYNVYHI